MIGDHSSIEAIVRKDLLECDSNTSIEEAAGKMRDSQCSSILVTTDGYPIGIWTEDDVLSLDFNDPQCFNTLISEVMSSPIKTIPINASLEEVVSRFKEEDFRHFLVADDDDKILGIVSQTDIVLNYDAEVFLHGREVSSVMKDAFCLVPGDALLSEAVRAMHILSCNAAIVESTGNDEPGILTDRDVVRLISHGTTSGTAGNVASKPLITIHQDALLISARELMVSKGIRHLGVTDEKGKVVGLLSFSEFLNGIQFEYIYWLKKSLEKRTEELRKNEARFKLLFERAPLGYQSLNEDGEIIEVNPAWQDMLGYSREEVVGHSFQDFLVEEGFVEKTLPRFKKAGEIQLPVTKMRCKDGSIKIIHIDGGIGYDAKGNFLQTHCILTDITERKRGEEALKKSRDEFERRVEERTIDLTHEIAERKDIENALRTSEEKFRLIIQKSPVPMALVDKEGRVEHFNDKFVELFGWTTDDVHDPDEWWNAAYPDPEYRALVKESWEAAGEEATSTDDEAAPQEWWLTCKNGEKRYVEFRMMPVSEGQSVITMLDLTDRTRAEEDKRLRVTQLAHASRLSLVGEMAAGMAHEINQPLTAINTYAQACIRELSNGGAYKFKQIKEDLEKISAQALRAAEIISWVRGFSKQQRSKLAPQDVNDIVCEAMSLSDLELISPQIEIDYLLADNLPKIKIKKTQIEQAVLNLVRNGIEAMESNSDGRHRMSIQTGIRPEGQIEITVSDEGPGIEQEDLKKIFDPFYSTKESGFGLGLAITKSIVEAHHGSLTISSEPGMGTTCTIMLPIGNSEDD